MSDVARVIYITVPIELALMAWVFPIHSYMYTAKLAAIRPEANGYITTCLRAGNETVYSICSTANLFLERVILTFFFAQSPQLSSLIQSVTFRSVEPIFGMYAEAQMVTLAIYLYENLGQ